MIFFRTLAFTLLEEKNRRNVEEKLRVFCDLHMANVSSVIYLLFSLHSSCVTIFFSSTYSSLYLCIYICIYVICISTTHLSTKCVVSPRTFSTLHHDVAIASIYIQSTSAHSKHRLAFYFLSSIHSLASFLYSISRYIFLFSLLLFWMTCSNDENGEWLVEKRKKKNK